MNKPAGQPSTIDRHSLVTRHRRAIVQGTYRLVLGRDPDAGGLAHWLGFMVSGGRVSDLLESLRVSDEAKVLAAAYTLKPPRETPPTDAALEAVGGIDTSAEFGSLNSRAQGLALRIAGAATGGADQAT